MSSPFYTSIAPYYDYIFPLRSSVLQFVLQRLKPFHALLDVGCATGELAFAVRPSCANVCGIDLDEELVTLARQKSGNSKNIEFHVANMLQMTEYYGHADFDVITCFGNTIPHLLDKKSITEFLTQSYKLLNSGGVVLIQLLNYKFIVENNVSSLPIIENDQIRFDRVYEFLPQSELIDFRTTLFIKSKNETIGNVSQLFAIQPSSMSNLLENVGFQSIDMYSSFNEDPLSHEQLPLVIVAKKP